MPPPRDPALASREASLRAMRLRSAPSDPTVADFSGPSFQPAPDVDFAKLPARGQAVLVVLVLAAACVTGFHLYAGWEEGLHRKETLAAQVDVHRFFGERGEAVPGGSEAAAMEAALNFSKPPVRKGPAAAAAAAAEPRGDLVKDALVARSPRKVFYYDLFLQYYIAAASELVIQLPTFNRSAMLDIGANDGKPYSMNAARRGLTVYAFEPAPANVDNYLRRIPGVRVVEASTDRGEAKPAVRFPARGGGRGKMRFLARAGVGDRNGYMRFFAAPCDGMEGKTCGKTNHLLAEGAEETAMLAEKFPEKVLRIPLVTLDWDVFGINGRDVFLMKVDVEGFEAAVIAGARHFLADSKIPFLLLEFGIEFGPNITSLPTSPAAAAAAPPVALPAGITRTPDGEERLARGVALLDLVRDLGYTCYHYRGTGDCRDAPKNTQQCKWPAPQTADPATAPSFEEYAAVFAYDIGGHGLADLLCVLNRTDSVHPEPAPWPPVK